MSAPGEEIGLARVYDFALESKYNTSTPSANEWDISLYDIQTFTKISFKSNHTLNTNFHSKESIVMLQFFKICSFRFYFITSI